MKGMGGGGMQALMRQANQMQTRMKKAQEELAAREFEATSGGNAVKIVMMGDYKVKSVDIQADVMSDKEMLQDLVATAVNEAIRVVKTTSDSEMAKITGGFSMPGMF
ncbi:MAG: YbaB/EbfC family nucleoid-associated protein [Bdellovibrionales bacterium]|nr:YbaB/EbfC family nucleoid-associated protein [Bdellovibrionales bacterium]